MTHPSPSYGFSRSTRNPDMAELLRKTPEINAIMQYESQCWTKNPPPATKPITSAGKTMPIVWNENVGLDRPLFLKNVLVSMVDIIIRRCESFFISIAFSFRLIETGTICLRNISVWTTGRILKCEKIGFLYSAHNLRTLTSLKTHSQQIMVRHCRTLQVCGYRP